MDFMRIVYVIFGVIVCIVVINFMMTGGYKGAISGIDNTSFISGLAIIVFGLWFYQGNWRNAAGFVGYQAKGPYDPFRRAVDY